MELFKFGKKKDAIGATPEDQSQQQQQQPQKPVGFTKRKSFLFFKIKSKPLFPQQPQPQSAAAPQPAAKQRQAQTQQPVATSQFRPIAPARKRSIFSSLLPKSKVRPMPPLLKAQPALAPKRGAKPSLQKTAAGGKGGGIKEYLAVVAARHRNLEAAVLEGSLRISPYEFVTRMFIVAIALALVMGIAIFILLVTFGLPYTYSAIFAYLFGGVTYLISFNQFINYPKAKGAVEGRAVEKDVLFAARDMVISLRSGMPLFNSIVAASTGYGAASIEFKHIVERIQLGVPIEQAIEEESNKSKSKTFKKIMLQTSVTLRSGADVVATLEGVVDEVEQERVIELRRYGQRLNALAMFYMLFGVIFPSMGVAVAMIFSTFISIFSITSATLVFVFIFLAFMQVIFLNLMKSSRPIFAL